MRKRHKVEVAVHGLGKAFSQRTRTALPGQTVLRWYRGYVATDGSNEEMSREEVGRAIETMLRGGTGSQADDQELVRRMMLSVPHPRVIGLIWYSDGTMSAEEILDSAYSDLPIEF